MPPLAERLRTTATRDKAQQSPLLNVRGEVRAEVQRALQGFKAELKTILTQIVAEQLSGVDGATIIEQLRPKKGRDYTDGEKGKDADEAAIADLVLSQIPKPKNGKDGTDGKNGSPDTPDQIISKVNRADKKIKRSQVEGLDVDLRNLRAAKQGGGGMGQPQHEQKSVGSSTTTFTVSYPIAAGGRAAWFYYQGQNLLWGTHYTVSASDRKTVTLTFTPQDSTFVDCTYIR